MEIARIEVGRTTGTCTRRGRIHAGIVGASVQVSFTDPVWDNLIKTVVFRGKETRIAEFDGIAAVIPHEVVAEPGVTLYFGIFGHDPESDLQIPLIEVRLGTTEASTDADADPGTDPTLPIWAQLQQDVEKLKQGGGDPGTPGKPGEDGGWYTPAVTQPEKNKIQFDFTPSKADMPAVNPIQVELPEGPGSGGNVDQEQITAAVNKALAEAKESGEFDGDDGYTPVKGKDYYTDADKAEIITELIDDTSLVANVTAMVRENIQYVKAPEKPTFVNSTAEMTDTNKAYLMPDGYLYGYREYENYNLLKLSEVSFSSRLDDSSSEIIASSTANAVTGWFPVTYGKYYTVSGYRHDLGARITYLPGVARVQLKLADGTIKIYTKVGGSNAYPVLSLKDDNGRAANVYGVDDENAVSMRMHLNSELLGETPAEAAKSLKFMIIEGSTSVEAVSKAIHSEYVDGDAEKFTEWYNTGLAYNQPADYEDRIIDLESSVSGLQADMADLEANLGNPASISPYYRDVNFGVLPFTYYQGLSDSYSSAGFTKNTKYAAFIAAWKALVANHSTYVTETELGAASDGQKLYRYDFKPARISNQDKPIPKIIIIAGQHGFEKSNVFGLYHFVDNLLNRWTEHPVLEYLRNHVTLTIVPVLNTYGFDTLEYKNANGVNTNRNYDSNWTLVEDTTSSNYGGAAPFDQPETQIVRDLVLSNANALMVIDFHTNGGTSVTSYESVNWCALYPSTDTYYNRMIDAVAHHLSSLTAHFNLDYALNQPGVMMGHMTNGSGTGLLRGWATANNFIGVLIEGFNGFPGLAEYTPEVFKANEEIIVNYLMTALHYLAK